MIECRDDRRSSLEDAWRQQSERFSLEAEAQGKLVRQIEAVQGYERQGKLLTITDTAKAGQTDMCRRDNRDSGGTGPTLSISARHRTEFSRYGSW